MQPCAQPTDLFVVSCPDPTLASVTLSSHMTNGILLTQHNQEITQWSPDPFPRERVGSGHETMNLLVHPPTHNVLPDKVLGRLALSLPQGPLKDWVAHLQGFPDLLAAPAVTTTLLKRRRVGAAQTALQGRYSVL